MKATLIIIGNEVLSGKTLDTNSNFIANQLQNIGIGVIRILTISDDIQIIKNSISEAFKNSDLVITTGGIGPTKDDKTKTALKEFYHDELVLDKTTLAHVKELLESRGRTELLEKNIEQALVLTKANVFQNDYGTAPCQMIEEKGQLLFSLPGVPYEVKPLIKEKIIPYLKNKFSLNYIINKSVVVIGIPESILSDMLEEWEFNLPPIIQVAYLPKGSTIELRLTTEGENKEYLHSILDIEIRKIKPMIGEDNILSYRGENKLELLKSILIKKRLKISTAESCTTGKIAGLLTSVPGSSSYYIGGIIPYDYHQKIKLLNVKEATIKHESVVSENVALEMARGCQKLFKTDISISTTGVAGPSSDEFNNKIGLMYYAIRIHDNEYAGKMYLPYLERGDFVEFVSEKIIEKLIMLIK